MEKRDGLAPPKRVLSDIYPKAMIFVLSLYLGVRGDGMILSILFRNMVDFLCSKDCYN